MYLKVKMPVLLMVHAILFRNDNNFDMKMYFTNTPDNIDVKIVKISS